ncbi:MAG TPA: DUF6152 family protein [Croceibacterium sp.]|nr:DUF6152 family protein [Croceibacterium sp.]
MDLKFLLGAALLVAAPAAEAHHSRAMFNVQAPVELTGTVREFQFTNPHCYIQLTVAGRTGQAEEWSVEMGPPHSLRERGWGKNTLKPGDRITLTIAPLRNGNRGGELHTLRSINGRPVEQRS